MLKRLFYTGILILLAFEVRSSFAAVALATLVTWQANFKMVADKMFLAPSSLIMAPSSGNEKTNGLLQ